MKTASKKFLCFISACFFILWGAKAQNNVGIGLNSGISARLHVANNDSSLLILQNTSPYADSTKTRLYFKNGTAFTAAIGTHITNGNNGLLPFSRLGFFTFASNSGNQLLERLSITDGGNIGIGTVNPTALLEVAGAAKTIGLTVTGSAEIKSGLKYTAGTPGLNKVLTSDALGNASWQNTSLNLPYNGTVDYFGAALQITNTNTQNTSGGINVTGSFGIRAKSTLTNGTAISGKAASTGGIGVFGESRISGVEYLGFANAGVTGITTDDYGVQAISTTGTALYAGSYDAAGTAAKLYAPGGGTALITDGKLKLTGIGEGLNKVLTSDANGNATWQSAAVGFSAYLTSNVALTAYTSKILTGFTEDFEDGGNNFNPATGIYTIPSAGAYEFTISLNFNGVISTVKQVFISIYKNGVKYRDFVVLAPALTEGVDYNTNVNSLVKLNAGDQISISILHNLNSTLNGGNLSNSTRVAAYKVY
jgi:hypothetical protein